MKRNNKKFIISSIFPIFNWQKCENCNEEFKLEKGWSISFKKGNFKYTYCKDCCPTKESIEKHFEHYNEYGLPVPPFKKDTN